MFSPVHSLDVVRNLALEIRSKKQANDTAQINLQCFVNTFYADYTSLMYMRAPAKTGLLFSIRDCPITCSTVLEVELQMKPFQGKL